MSEPSEYFQVVNALSSLIKKYKSIQAYESRYPQSGPDESDKTIEESRQIAFKLASIRSEFESIMCGTSD